MTRKKNAWNKKDNTAGSDALILILCIKKKQKHNAKSVEYSFKEIVLNILRNLLFHFLAESEMRRLIFLSYLCYTCEATARS